MIFAIFAGLLLTWVQKRKKSVAHKIRKQCLIKWLIFCLLLMCGKYFINESSKIATTNKTTNTFCLQHSHIRLSRMEIESKIRFVSRNKYFRFSNCELSETDRFPFNCFKNAKRNFHFDMYISLFEYLIKLKLSGRNFFARIERNYQWIFNIFFYRCSSYIHWTTRYVCVWSLVCG